LHSDLSFAWVERLGSRGIGVLAALGGGLLALAIPAFTPVFVDLALIVSGTAGLIAAVLALQTHRRLVALPLELGDVMARGRVDGRDVLRLRARLGRGRAARDPAVEITFEGTDGDRVDLEALIPAVSLCGPFTVQCASPLGPGRVHVRLTVWANGQRWHAQASYALDAGVVGRFGGVAIVAGRVRWTAGWDRPV